MTKGSQTWTERFSPKSLDDLVGNEKAIEQLLRWVRSWEKSIPKKRAAFLHGPPGVGKTSSVVALANDLGYHLLEVNASDYRTAERLESLIGRAVKQRITVFGRRRIILVDELEGISGRQDRGGITSLVNIIKESQIPIVLVASSTTEGWEEKFNPLTKLSLIIKFFPVPFDEVLQKLENIADKVGVTADLEALEVLAEKSRGDLRSVVNDLETVVAGRSHISLEDVKWLEERDRQTYTPETLMNMFSSKTLREARKAISSTYLRYDDLYEWIYENLPFILDDPIDLAMGLDALSRADIHQNRARSTQAYRLLKYMFNQMTGGVALSRHRSKSVGIVNQVRTKIMKLGLPPSTFTVNERPEGVVVNPIRYLGDSWGSVNSNLREMGGNWIRSEGYWVIPYFHPPQLVWRYRKTWHSRRLRRSVASRVAEKCHVSTQEAVSEVIPLLKIIFQGEDKMAEEISQWLELEDREESWLRSRH